MTMMQKHKSVLIVDDDEMIRLLAEKMVKRLGYNVCGICADVDEAMTCINKFGARVDLVFTDVIMPGSTGVDFVRIIYSVYPGMKFLLSSGQHNGELDKITVDQKRIFFLQKPYGYEEIRALMEKIFSSN